MRLWQLSSRVLPKALTPLSEAMAWLIRSFSCSNSATIFSIRSWSPAEVPILNPGLVAFKLCEALLDLGLTHSKKAYPAPKRSTTTSFARCRPGFLKKGVFHAKL
jgi:hypothetical protein